MEELGKQHGEGTSVPPVRDERIAKLGVLRPKRQRRDAPKITHLASLGNK